MSEPTDPTTGTGSGQSESAPLILEGFRPVSESMEWRVADLYWAKPADVAGQADRCSHPSSGMVQITGQSGLIHLPGAIARK
jgi:hypothetical protein